MRLAAPTRLGCLLALSASGACGGGQPASPNAWFDEPTRELGLPAPSGDWPDGAYFTPEIMDKLTIGDRVQVRAYGCGLRLLDAPQVKLLSMSVQLLRALPLEVADGVVSVPVAGIVPPELMGAGIGQASARVDYDIQTADRETLAQHGLANLRLGDLVALRDQDNTFSHGYRKGAWAIASISHADSVMAGHGPGVTTLLASPTGHLRPYLAPDAANLATLLKLRT